MVKDVVMNMNRKKEFVSPDFQKLNQFARKMIELEETKSGLTCRQKYQQIEDLTKFLQALVKMNTSSLEVEAINTDRG